MLENTEPGNILEEHNIRNNLARVAELVDALDLGSRFWGFDSPLGYKIQKNENRYKLRKHKTFSN